MALQMQRPREIISGIFVLFIGAFFFIFGRDLEMGNSFQMGAGYIPRALSVMTMILGAILIYKGARGARIETGLTDIPWRGFLGNLGAVVLFGLCLKGLGLGPCVFLAVLITASTSQYAKLRSSLLLALGMAIFCSLLFHYVLGLALPIFGPWLFVSNWF